MVEGRALGWLVHTAVGGGLLLLAACAWMRWTRSPARRQRLGEWAVLAALLLAGFGLVRVFRRRPTHVLEAPRA
jgi:hypothetical protein